MTDSTVFAPAHQPVRIISFSLYGNGPQYRKGFAANVDLAREHYDGWKVWCYTDRYTPESALADRTLVMGESPDARGMQWRFLSAGVSWADAVIFRDADSRLNARESAAVNEWLESVLPYSSLHDNRHHRIHPLLGGMWGVRPRMVDCSTWVEEARLRSTVPAKWGDDQHFLAEKVFDPTATLHHSSVELEWPSRPFTVELPGGQFVGQQYTADHRPIFPR